MEYNSRTKSHKNTKKVDDRSNIKETKGQKIVTFYPSCKYSRAKIESIQQFRYNQMVILKKYCIIPSTLSMSMGHTH